jgi:hypothetical protein
MKVKNYDWLCAQTLYIVYHILSSWSGCDTVWWCVPCFQYRSPLCNDSICSQLSMWIIVGCILLWWLVIGRLSMQQDTTECRKWLDIYIRKPSDVLKSSCSRHSITAWISYAITANAAIAAIFLYPDIGRVLNVLFLPVPREWVRYRELRVFTIEMDTMRPFLQKTVGFSVRTYSYYQTGFFLNVPLLRLPLRLTLPRG